MILRLDIINHILSFRQTHPVALLINNLVKYINLLYPLEYNFYRNYCIMMDYKQYLKWK